MSAVILLILGAKEEDVLADYMQTDASLHHHRKNAESAYNPPADSSGEVNNVFPLVIQGTLRFLKEEYGGLESYLDQIGFGFGDRNQLRSLLVEPERAQKDERQPAASSKL